MTRIHFNTLEIEEIVSGSSLFNTPENKPTNWKSKKKENQSFGEINGNEITLKELLALTDDQDYLDMK